MKGARQSALQDVQRKKSLEHLKKEAEERKARSEESRRRREEEVRREIEEVRHWSRETPTLWILILPSAIIMDVVLCVWVLSSHLTTVKHLAKHVFLSLWSKIAIVWLHHTLDFFVHM